MARSLFTAAFVGCLAVVPWGWAAHADSARTPPVHLGPKISIQGYGKQNPECRAWTDGCVLCSSDATGHSECSTPGIACQPHGLTCKLLVKTP